MWCESEGQGTFRSEVIAISGSLDIVMETTKQILIGIEITLNRNEGSGNAPFATIVALRAACWRERIPNRTLLDDGHDEHAFHWWVEVSGNIVAAARLCVHSDLTSVPSSHLYSQIRPETLQGEIGCINRLVVDTTWRRKGLAGWLDSAREDSARNLGCRSMVAAWNAASGEARRAALLNLGFVSLSDNSPVPDGEFGFSFPFGKTLA